MFESHCCRPLAVGIGFTLELSRHFIKTINISALPARKSDWVQLGVDEGISIIILLLKVKDKTPVHWLISQILLKSGWARARAGVWSQEPNPGLLQGRQEPNYLSHQCCLPSFTLAGSSNWEPVPGIIPRNSNMGCSCSNRHLNLKAKHPL